jgi:beta-galactosidase
LPGGRLGPELREACGIYPEEIDFLRPDERVLLEPSEWVRGDAVRRCDLVRTDSAEVMINYQSEFYAGYAALTRKEYGEGAFWYCGCGLEAQGYDRLYERLCAMAGVSGALDTTSSSVVIRERRSEDTRFVFILNLTQIPNKVSVGAGWVSALTGESISDEVVVDAYDVVILSQPIEGR